MHPEVKKYVTAMERQAAANGPVRKRLHPVAILFLEEVWGPVFHFHYEGLTLEHQPCTVFLCSREDTKVLIEIADTSDNLGHMVPGETNEQLFWQNDLILSGWLFLRFSAELIKRYPGLCQKQLKQAADYRHLPPRTASSSKETDIWELRKGIVIQMAMRHNGTIRPREVAAEFNISIRSAAEWLRRLAVEGMLSLTAGPKQSKVYSLRDSVR